MLSYFSWLKVPKIYWPLSTDRVLTMEFCSGGFIDDVNYMKENKIDLVGISNKISQVTISSHLADAVCI
jgi:aarF domain-containing kinase